MNVREQVVRIGRALAHAGQVVAAGGNIAARSTGDRLWVTPTGWPLGELDPQQLAEVRADDGRQVGGDYAATTELAVHLAALHERPEVAWSVHVHPPMATLLDALDIDIRTITTDHAFYLRSVVRTPYRHPGSPELAEVVAHAAATGADVILLRHHGCLVLADSPDLVLSRALNLEAAATATYRAHLLGDPTATCPPEFLQHVAATEAAGTRYGRKSPDPPAQPA